MNRSQGPASVRIWPEHPWAALACASPVRSLADHARGLTTAKRPVPEGTGLFYPRGQTLDSDGDDAELHQEIHEERGNGDPEEGLHVASLP